MSSTYAHYGSSPGSLPSDYGLISRYNQHKNLSRQEAMENDASSSAHDDTAARLHSRSFTYGTTSQHATSGINNLVDSRPHREFRSETEPLLSHIPKVPEEDDGNNNPERHPGWSEFWIISRYTAPVLGTHVLEYSLVVAPVVSIGHISTTALASATLGSMTASVTGYSILQGFASSLDTLLPGSWTGPHPELVGLWSQRMTFIMALSLIPIICIWLSAEDILLLLRQEPEVARLAGIYLRWTILTLPAYGMNNVTRRYFQSQGLFTVPTRIVMIVAPINAFLNWLLVWGPMPIRLGFIGAPIANAISMNLISLMSILYGIYFAPKTAWHPISRRSFQSLRVVFKLGVSSVVQTASEWWSWELVGLAASLLGSVSLASQSVLLISASMSYQAPFALSVATSVRVGNLLGEGNGQRAGLAAKVALLITLGIALVLSTIYTVFRKKWGLLFNNDPEVVEMVALILPLVALFQVFDGLSATAGGILRARGRQFTGAILNLSAYYIVGIPFGLLLAFRFDMGLLGLWIGLTTALIYCAVIGVWLNFRTDWNLEVQKVMDRLERERQLAKQVSNQVNGNA